MPTLFKSLSLAAVLCMLLCGCAFGPGASGTVISATPAPTATPEPTESPEEAALAMATTASNATKDAPQITDPSTWEEEGRALLARLAADPQLTAKGFSLTAQPDKPYLLAVNRSANTVTVYTADADGQYAIPFMAMVCSDASDTPLGYWKTPEKYDWRLLFGPCYGQYATRIGGNYLFHSVPYYTQHKDDLEYDQFNELGTCASLGCIRLMVVDVKWIYDNCPLGTPVVIYDDPENPGPMGKPGTIYTDPADETLRGWDPTDPDPANPWDEGYLTGTTIRSQAAWEQWEEWQKTAASSLTPTDLQGYSTDSSVEGTRG